MAAISVSASLLKCSVAHKINNIRSMPIKLGQMKKPSLQLQRTSFKLRAAAEKKDSDDKYLETRPNKLLKARELIRELLKDKKLQKYVAEVLKCSDEEFIEITAKAFVEHVESERRRAAKKKDSGEEGGEARKPYDHLLLRARELERDYLTEVEKRAREAVHESMTDSTEEMVYLGEVSTKLPLYFETHPELGARVQALIEILRRLPRKEYDGVTEDEEREIVNLLDWIENFCKDKYPIVEASPEPTVEGKAKDEEK